MVDAQDKAEKDPKDSKPAEQQATKPEKKQEPEKKQDSKDQQPKPEPKQAPAIKPDPAQEKLLQGVKKAGMKGDVKKLDRLIDALRRRSGRIEAAKSAKPAAPPKPATQPSSIVQIRDISIVLDTYDDIFSDFDPRPYSKRALSDDFLKEIRARYRESRTGRFEVQFILPAKMRDQKIETIVKKRLREYFAFDGKSLGDSLHRRRIRGLVYTGVGAALLAAQTALTTSFGFPLANSELFAILLVPAGWYGVWEGIGLIIETPNEMGTNIALALKFEKADYTFISQEEADRLAIELGQAAQK
ncbi:MAG: hypothetical protein WC506_02770 [Candidatus Micrarchaeia archaeon]